MKKSTKAVLLSALVFPGAGHILLKKYMTGVALVGVSFAAVWYLVSTTVEKSLQIVEQIQSGYVQPDVASIMELASKQETGTEADLLDIATYVLIICWLIGIIDSYRVGRVRDKKEAA